MENKFFFTIVLIIGLGNSIILGQTGCPTITNLGCTPAAFINATYTNGYVCKGDGRTLEEIINWNGTFGSGPNATATAEVVFMTRCDNSLPPPSPGQLSLYWTNFSQPGKLQLTDVIGDFITCSGTWAPPTGGTCTNGQICIYPVTVISVTGNLACYDPNCFAALPPVCIQLGAVCANANATPNPVCEGQTATLTATGGGIYEWSDGLGNNSSVTVNPSTSTTYTVTVTSASLATCTDNATVTVNTTPNVTTTFDAIGPLCKNASPPTLSNASNNSPPIIGTWSPNTINTSTAGTTTYTFTPNQGQCGTIFSMDITILDDITPSVGPFGPYCINETPDVLPTSSNDTPPISGTWSPANINTSLAGSYPYTFTPTTSTGCTVPITISITINPQVIPTFNPIDPICINRTPPPLPNNSNNIPPISGTWNPSVINTASSGNFTYNFIPDQNQCATNTSVAVTITPEVIPTFTPIQPICQGDAPPTLPGASNNTPSISGTWSPATINTSNSGTFTYTFTPDSDECASIATIDVIINPDVTPTFNPIGPLCQNSTPPPLPGISNEGISGNWNPATINTGATGISTYTFTGSSTPCSQSTIQIQILGNITPTFTPLGPYCLNESAGTLPNQSNNGIQGSWSPATINTNTVGTTIYTFTPNSGQCGNTTTMSITVSNPVIPTFGVQTNYCQNSAPQNLPSISNNGVNGSWSPSAINTSNVGTTTYTFTPASNQCALPVTINVVITAPIVPNFVPSTLTFCQNTNPTALPNISNNGISGTWNPATISTINVGTFTYTFTPNAPQCATIATLDVVITTPPTPTFTPFPDYCQNATPGSLPPMSIEGISGTWNPANISTSTVGNSIYTFTPTSGTCGTTTTISITTLSSPSGVNAAITPASCGQSDGSVNILNVINGTGPYLYDFDNVGFSTNTNYSGLSAGSYPLVIQDNNGCLYNTIMSVSNASGPNGMQFQTTPDICNNANGALIITSVSGGTTPYMYSFNGGPFTNNPSFTGLSAGTYSIGVTDANGCNYNTSVIIGTITGPTGIQITTTEASCGMSNGTLTLGNVSGGTTPYQYSINGSAFSSATFYGTLSSGIYTIIIRDANSCEFTITTNINETNGPTSITPLVTDANCGMSNGSITIVGTTGGTSPYQYSLNGSSFSNINTFGNLATGTYNITVQDVMGCSFSNSVVVNENGGPTNANISVTNATCNQSNGILTINSVTGNNPPYTYSINGSAFSNATIYQNLAAGNYTVVIKDNSGCTLNQTISITNTNGPTNIAITKTDATCGQMNGSVQLGIVTGGTSPYTFSFNNTPFSNQTQYSGLGSGNYTLIIKDANGCEFNTTVSITSPNSPTSITINAQSATCNTNNGTVTLGAVTGGMPPFTYSFNGSAFISNTIFPDLGAGMYSVKVRDANGCIIDTSAVIIAIPSPTDLKLLISETNCGTASGKIEIDSVLGGVAPYTFSFEGGTFSTTKQFNNLAAGSYTITVKDATGCTFTKIAQVNNIGGPTNVAITIIDEKCGKMDGAISLGAVTGGTPPMEFNFDNQGFGTLMTFNNLSAGMHIIAVRDANGCLFSRTVDIKNLGEFSSTLIATNTTCGKNNGSVKSTLTGNNYTFKWSNGSTSASISSLAPDTYEVTITDLNFGCVKINSINVAGSTALSIVCSAQDVTTINGIDGKATINVTGFTAPYNIAWLGNQSGNVVGITQNSHTIQNLGVGVYSVTVTDINGCTDDCTFEIKNKDCLMTALANGTNTSCFGGDDGTISLVIANATGTPIIKWSNPQWNNQLVITNASAGNYSVTVTDALNCLVTESVLVGQPTDIILDCKGNSISAPGETDGSAVVSISGGTPNYTVGWSGVQNGNLLNQAQGNTMIENLPLGDYSVTVTDNNACMKTCLVTIGTAPCPLKATIVQNPISCENACDGNINIIVSNASGATQIQWNNTNLNGLYSLENLCPGQYAATISDAENCTTMVSTTLSEPLPWMVSISADRIYAYLNEVVNLKLTTSLPDNNIASIQWNADSQLSCTKCTEPDIKLQNTTTFEVVVTDINGCTNTAKITIYINEVYEVYFPNVLNIGSTTGNAIFFPIGKAEKIQNINSLQIYDRWGNNVFFKENLSVNDPSQGWNGHYKGQKVEVGVYVYYAEVEFRDGSKEKYYGDITVLK